MGVKSTQNLTRNQIKKYIFGLLNSLEETFSNDTLLERIAEELAEANGDIFTNFNIISDESVKQTALAKLTYEEKQALGLV